MLQSRPIILHRNIQCTKPLQGRSLNDSSEESLGGVNVSFIIGSQSSQVLLHSIINILAAISLESGILDTKGRGHPDRIDLALSGRATGTGWTTYNLWYNTLVGKFPLRSSDYSTHQHGIFFFDVLALSSLVAASKHVLSRRETS